MTRHLCLSVTFLDSVFHGRGDADEPEWPPSPMRLFQALLAGARTGCRDSEWSETKAEAFRWLEHLDPPIIVAPDTSTGTEYRISVPNNDSDVPAGFWAKGKEPGENQQPAKLRTIKEIHATWLHGNAVHYLWSLPDEQSAAQHTEILCREANHILSLGWGIDQVVGSGRVVEDGDVSDLTGKRWRPWSAFRPGEQTLRVPKAGSLADLESVHQRFIKRLDRRFSQFNPVIYLSANKVPPRSFAAFELPDGVSFRQENAARVAAMLRSVTCDFAKSDTHDFPGGSEAYVAGHAGSQDSTPPRFSYLPLPSIGGEHADGMIRRLLIAEPFGGDGGHARWARQRLHGAVLTDNSGNERGRLLDPWRRTSRAMFDRYIKESRDWCTVTPVIPPGYDDKSQVKAERLLFTAVRQAGLPVEAISDVTMCKAPFFPGSQHPRQYFLPDYLKGRPWWHVRLVFREPVPGPLSIGAGRHLGLGILARCED